MNGETEKPQGRAEMTKEAVERAEIMNGFANCVCYLAMAKDRLRAMGADV